MNILLKPNFNPVPQAPIQITNPVGGRVVARTDVAIPEMPSKPGVPARGFGVDLNSDGRIENGNDGFIAFKNGKGEYDIQRANDLLKAFSGGADFDGDGTVSEQETERAGKLRQEGGKMDLDRDGVLNNWELQKAGAKIVKVKKNEEGKTVQTEHDLPAVEPGSEEHQAQIEYQMLQYQMMQQQMAFQQMMASSFYQTYFSMQNSMSMGMGFGGGGLGPGGYPAGLAMPIY